MPEPPDSSESVPENSSESVPENEEEHDKQGLELAKSLAGRLKQQAAKGGFKPVKRRRRPRIDGAQISSARPDDRDPQKLTN
ncbi:MAG TPA: DUF721 domain-containing protein, partial [Kribbella sp.]|nr:DUF721 domain-containing protein [Kribbella sp.]